MSDTAKAAIKIDLAKWVGSRGSGWRVDWSAIVEEIAPFIDRAYNAGVAAGSVSERTLIEARRQASRPRVIRCGDQEWRCVGSVIESRYIGPRPPAFGGGEWLWSRDVAYVPYGELVAVWVDLLQNPNETVEDTP